MVVGRENGCFALALLVAAACSGKSVRHEDGSGDHGNDDSSSGGADSRSGGVGGAAAGGGVSRGGAVSNGGAGSPGGDSGGGGSGTSTGGSAGVECGSPDGSESWEPDECWDGRTCRTPLESSYCPQTYAAALERSPGDGVNCAATTTEGFVYVHQDFAETLCAYGPDGRLIAAEYMNDYYAHCGERAAIVVSGEPLPAQFVLTDFGKYGGCMLSGSDFSALSPSEIFNGRFPLVTAGRPCTPGIDACRSSILLLVCREDDEGESCDVCATDEECSAEYEYFAPDGLRCVDGACLLDERPLGTCTEGEPAPECRTAAASYVCDFGTCSVCITHQECVLATGGARPICSEGTCVSAADGQKARPQSSTK